MACCVLDCSVAMSWFFNDEASPETYAIQDSIMDDGAYVPCIWYLEIVNSLMMAEKRGRASEVDTNNSVELLKGLSIFDDDLHLTSLWNRIFGIAKEYRLTAYDAAYLELALRMKLPLATKDSALRKAAKKAGIAVLPK